MTRPEPMLRPTPAPAASPARPPVGWLIAMWLTATAVGPGGRNRARPGALGDVGKGGSRRPPWPGRGRRAPFPLYGVAAWPGSTFVVQQHHIDGRLAELTVGFADTGAPDHACVRVTSTRRPPSRTDERLARHLDPWLAAVVGEARGHDRLDLVADPEAVVQLSSRWQPTPVAVDDEPITFRVRAEDGAWVAYARGPDHAVLVCAEPTAPVTPETVRLATARDIAGLEGQAGARRRSDRRRGR